MSYFYFYFLPLNSSLIGKAHSFFLCRSSPLPPNNPRGEGSLDGGEYFLLSCVLHKTALGPPTIPASTPRSGHAAFPKSFPPPLSRHVQVEGWRISGRLVGRWGGVVGRVTPATEAGLAPPPLRQLHPGRLPMPTALRWLPCLKHGGLRRWDGPRCPGLSSSLGVHSTVGCDPLPSPYMRQGYGVACYCPIAQNIGDCSHTRHPCP